MNCKKCIILILAFIIITACLPQWGTSDSGGDTPIKVTGQPSSAEDDDSTASIHRPVDGTPFPAGTSSPDSLIILTPNGGDMERGSVFVEGSEILLLESYPVQVELRVLGNLPTPCHVLKAHVDEPDQQNRIYVEVFSLSDPGKICAQVLKPFDIKVPLGSYSEGGYSVYLNEEYMGDFEL